MQTDFDADLAAVAGIPAVATILDVVCRTTGMGFAAVARVTADRWIACAVQDTIGFGLGVGGELQVETTICHEIQASRQAVIIDNVAEDAEYCAHPTPARYAFQSYISMPIVLADGTLFGTLCAIDPRPARLNTPETIGMFKLFADLIAFHLDASMRLATSEARLRDERRDADLREQFIAVLGHDLRNPLASIASGARMLLRSPLDDKAARTVGLVQRSVERMSVLIDNVLDFARGRLGGGLTLARSEDALQPYLEQVVEELRVTHPDRTIETDFSIAAPVLCDAGRISQLLSNLVGNALIHGAKHSPVVVRATTYAALFELSVSNTGDQIPDPALERLFQPFFRGELRPGQQGLGLGLYIASEIARAHDGVLAVASSPLETRFTFRMAV